MKRHAMPIDIDRGQSRPHPDGPVDGRGVEVPRPVVTRSGAEATALPGPGW